MAKRKTIINPNSITQAEQEFIKQGLVGVPAVEKVEKNREKSKAKSRNISANDEQWNMIDAYLSENPQEGKRSTFLMRVVLNYIMEQDKK
jgi:hypothetical protein